VSEKCEKGETIREAIRSLRKFHGDVALLLRTADGPLGKEEWKWKPCSKKSANIATPGGSTSINEPHKWMPSYACRFYENDDRSDVVLFVSVIMDNLDNPDAIKEPLVSAGYISYEKQVTGWEWWYSAVASWIEIVSNGEPQELKPAHLPNAKETYGVKGGKVLARPLVAVKKAEELETLVLKPLLSQMP